MASNRYKAVKQLDAGEIEALKPVIGTREFCGIGGLSMPTGQRILATGIIKSARKVGHSWKLSKADALRFFGLADA